MTASNSEVDSIRAASRMMVRELGFMQPTLAATNYSASAVHALLEIDSHVNMASAQLVQLLGLDKSSVSRMLAKLIAAGELHEEADSSDSRVKLLRLTEQGCKTVEHIHIFGQMQVKSAFEYLNRSQQQAVAQGLCAYAEALKAHRLNAAEPQQSSSVTVTTGYRPGLVGRMVEMHAAFYSTHSKFGQFFESQVATGVAEFRWAAESAMQPCMASHAQWSSRRLAGYRWSGLGEQQSPSALVYLGRWLSGQRGWQALDGRGHGVLRYPRIQ